MIVVYDKKGAFGSVGTFTDDDLELLKAITPVMSSIIQGAHKQLGKSKKGLGTCDLAVKFSQVGEVGGKK